MSEVIPFPTPSERPTEPAEAMVLCDVFSPEHGPMDLIPAQYREGDPIPVQLRREGIILRETEIRTLADYQTLRADVKPAPEIQLYYRITGTIRFRWLWLWGEDWESSPEAAFKLLQDRFGRNMREEWMSERRARGIFKDESIVYCSFIPCDWATFPDSFPYSPKAKRFRMAVLNGKAAFKALAGHEQRLEEEEERNKLVLDLLDPDDWQTFTEMERNNDPRTVEIDLANPLVSKRHDEFMKLRRQEKIEVLARDGIRPEDLVPPRPGEPIAHLTR